MKKLFNHTKRPYQKWEEYDEENFDWDADQEPDEVAEYAEEDGAYYADGEYDTIEQEGEYYEEAAEGAEYYAEEQGGEYYEADGEEAEYYAEDAYDTEENEGEYYAEESGEAEYYADGEYADEEAEGEYYEAAAQEAEYYADDEYADGELEGEYYEEAVAGAEYYAEEQDGEYYEADGEEAEYYAEEQDEYYEEETYAISGVTMAEKKSKAKNSDNIFVSLWEKFMDMAVMDRIITTTGVLVLIMALVTGSIYVSARMIDTDASEFAGVGTQLDGITLIGEQGLLAVTDAHKARIAAANALEQEQGDEPQSPGYNENDFNNHTVVELDLVSVQKDLKIKFTNQKNNKLVSNVPFSVTVTNADGQRATWNDDDMDGIIYKKGITPGTYKVSVDPLENAKYEDYTLPTDTRTVEVKKEIAYTKLDIGNEIKDESEVDPTKEDTKQKDTPIESKLEDTVPWVESTATTNTYIEVSKNSIPDPLTLVTTGGFMRMALTAGISQSSGTISVGDTLTLTAQFTGSGATPTNIKWVSSNPSVATVVGNGATATVTAVGKGNVSISYTYDTAVVSGGDSNAGQTNLPGGTCMVTVQEKVDTVGTITVSPASMTLAVGAQATSWVVPTGFTAGKALTYAVNTGNANVATATVDANGMVTVKGVAAGDTVINVSANYAEKPAATAATATINVKVTAMTLDTTATTVYLGTPVTIHATIPNAAASGAVTAESSDTNVATVAVADKAITITGVNAGSATITVKYTENGVELKATCAVTVKGHPKDDTTSKLKDGDGNQLYVAENNVYREATYADYYNHSQFFKKGEIKYTGWQTLDGKVYFFTASGEKVTGEQVIQGAKYTFASDGSLVTGSGTMGIDVSKWNGTIDWNAVKNSGISYVIIRSGYRGSSKGALIEDPKFKSNIEGATKAGLKVGIYFFTQAVDEVEAVEEASMVLEQVKNYKISYPIFLDVEPSGGRADKLDKATRTAVCKAFCKTIQDEGYVAGIYANKTWLNTKIDVSQLSQYKIWLAQYAATPTYTGRYDLWQYSSTGKVSGISGNVDLNLSYLGY